MNTQETYEAYKAKMRKQVSELDIQIQQLKLKAQTVKAEKQQQYEAMIADLETKRNSIQSRIDEFRSNSADAFDELKEGIEKAWTELTRAFDKAKASF